MTGHAPSKARTRVRVSMVRYGLPYSTCSITSTRELLPSGHPSSIIRAFLQRATCPAEEGKRKLEPGSWNLEVFADDCRIWRNRRGRKPERRITWLTHVPRVSSVVPPVVSLLSFISLLPINLLFFPFPLTSTGEAHNNLSTGAVCCHRPQIFFTEIFAVTSFDTSKLSRTQSLELEGTYLNPLQP